MDKKKELREAMDCIKGFYGDNLHTKDAGRVTIATRTLLSFVEGILSTNGDMPKEMDTCDQTYPCPKDCYPRLGCDQRGYNKGRSDMLSYFTAKCVGCKPTIEEIRQVIIQKELTPTICKDSEQAEWTVGESRKLATAIHKLIGGGREVNE